ncbi:MAG: PilN domain-containing protein [Armatimonadetes bacterium]|nr:PilN domain-containing protein [Armatimonadota bacterium]MCA1997883.1 PilN domain-containing protein [Armatimonadota bacterium]
MPMINLIHEQRQAQRAAAAKARLLVFGLGFLTGGSFLAFLFLMFLTASKEAECSQMQARLQKMRPVVERIEADEKRLAEMGPKVATLENAQAATAKWQRVMEHLTQNTPPGIWLTNVRSTTTDPKNPVQVSFTGLSGNQDSVGGYILRLQNCPELGDVNLKFTQEKATQYGPTVEFEISGVVLGTQEEEEKKDGEEAAKEGQKA